MSKTDINLKLKSKKNIPVLSVSYLDKHIDRPNIYLTRYLTKTRKPTLRKDLIHLTTELIEQAKQAKQATTGLTKLKNKLLKNEINVKDYFEYQKISHQIIDKARKFTTFSQTKASSLFTEAKYLTKTGKLRKSGRKKIKKANDLFLKRLSIKAKKLAMQQLNTVISRVLKTDGLGERAIANGGVIDYVEPYLVNHIMTTMNIYVIGYDLLSEIFEDFTWLPDGAIANAKLTPNAYLIAREIDKYITSGDYAGLSGFYQGKLKRSAPVVRKSRNIKARKINK